MPIGMLLEKAKNYIKGPQKTQESPSSATNKVREKTRASIDEVLKNPVDPEKKAVLDLLYNPQVPKEQKLGVKIINKISRKERIVSGITESGNLILDHYHAETGAKIREAFPRKVLEADQYRIKNSGNLITATKSPEGPIPLRPNEVVTFQRNGKERQGKIIGTSKGNLVLIESGTSKPTLAKKEEIETYESRPLEKNGATSFDIREIAEGHAKRFFEKSDKKLNKLKKLAP